MTYLFSKKKDDILIDMVRDNPILYDPYHDHFKNLILKHQIWENISNTLGIPMKDVKKRWRHFRDHYLKKVKLNEAGLTKGKKWEHMHRLQFLALARARRPADDDDSGARLADAAPAPARREHVVYMVPADALGDSSQHSCDTDDDSRNLLESSIKKRKHSNDNSTEQEDPQSSKTNEERLHEISELTQRVLLPEIEKSPIHKFFDSMADIVAQFPPRLAAEARLKVCQIITEVEMKVHNEQMQWQEASLRPVKREQ